MINKQRNYCKGWEGRFSISPPRDLRVINTEYVLRNGQAASRSSLPVTFVWDFGPAPYCYATCPPKRGRSSAPGADVGVD